MSAVTSRHSVKGRATVGEGSRETQRATTRHAALTTGHCVTTCTYNSTYGVVKGSQDEAGHDPVHPRAEVVLAMMAILKMVMVRRKKETYASREQDRV